MITHSVALLKRIKRYKLWTVTLGNITVTCNALPHTIVIPPIPSKKRGNLAQQMGYIFCTSNCSLEKKKENRFAVDLFKSVIFQRFQYGVFYPIKFTLACVSLTN